MAHTTDHQKSIAWLRCLIERYNREHDWAHDEAPDNTTEMLTWCQQLADLLEDNCDLAGLDRRYIGAMIWKHRLRAELSQEKLAGQAGLSEQEVNLLEAGLHGSPQFKTLEKLAHALGVSVSQLTGGSHGEDAKQGSKDSC